MNKLKLTISTLVLFATLTALSSPVFAIGASPLRLMLTATPGQTIDGYVNAQNTTDKDVIVNLKKGDFIVDENESLKFNFEYDENNKYSLLNWIEFTDNDVKVGPRESKEIRYKINIPEDAKSQGYYGTVFVQGNDPLKPSNVPGVGIAANVAQLILLEVNGDDLNRDAQLTNFNIVHNDSIEDKYQVNFEAQMFNNGNTHDFASGRIIITNFKREILQELEFNRDKYHVMPQTPKTYVEAWDYKDYEAETYFAYIDALNKDNQKVTAELKFRVTRESEIEVLNLTLGRSYEDGVRIANEFNYMPIYFGSIILLGLILSLATLERKPKKRGRKPKK